MTARALHFLLLIVLAARSRGLRMLDVRVPHYGNLYESVTMSCNFDQGGVGLYSVKWYKDDFEFFRYLPDADQPKLALPVRAITVDVRASNMTSIRLTHLEFNSSGIYRCEVSTEAPNFDTVVGIGNMTVIALPHDGPIIEGVLPMYNVGDYVNTTCSSIRSFPAASLAWYINGIKAEPYLLRNLTRPRQPDQEGLYTCSLALRFQLERHHFQQAGSAVELRCSAKVEGQSWDRAVRPVLADPSNQKLAQERLSNAAVASYERSFASCVVLVLFSALWS